MKKRTASRFKNVRIVSDTARKNGVRNDRYFLIRYRKNNKEFEEGYGWESEGFTEKGAFDLVCQIRQNIKSGIGFQSLKEKRFLEEQRRQKIEEEIEAEKKLKITINDFFETIYRPYGMQGISEKTKNNYQSMYYKHLKPVIGHKCFKDVTSLDLEKLKNSLLLPEDAKAKNIDKRNLLTPSTVDKILGIVRKMYDKAEDYDIYYGKKPTKNIKLPKRDNRRLRFLRADEEELLLERLKKIETREHFFGYDYYLKNKISQPYEISLLAFDSGMRANEIFSLKVFDIDFETGFITLLDTKNKENRYVPMSDRVKEMLKRHISGIKGLKGNSLVFQTQYGTQIKQMTNRFQEIVDGLGLNDNIPDKRYRAVFHNLRHTFISNLFQKGVQGKTTQRIVGHKTSSMTDRYTHLAPNNLSEAIKVLN